MNAGLPALAAEIRACRLCRDRPDGPPLPHEPRPVFVASPTAPILIAGQAPGVRVHATGVPFNDPSGDRLRAWLDVSREEFYDSSRFAIAPMSFCFPGLDAHRSDLPPRRECAPAWRARLLASMPQIGLVLAIGGHAHAWHLGLEKRTTVAGAVAAWREIASRPGLPRVFPLPHPSWRNSGWLKRNPWFEVELLPELRSAVARVFGKK